MKLLLLVLAAVAATALAEECKLNLPIGIETYEDADGEPEDNKLVGDKSDADPCKATLNFFDCERKDNFLKRIKNKCDYNKLVKKAPSYISFFNEFRVEEVEELWECVQEEAFRAGIEDPAEMTECIELTRTLIDPVGSTTLSTSASTTMSTTAPPTTTATSTPTTTPLPDGEIAKVRYAGIIDEKTTCVANVEFGDKETMKKYKAKAEKCLDKSIKNGFDPSKEKNFFEDDIKGEVNKYLECLIKEAENLDAYGTLQLAQCGILTRAILGYIDLPKSIPEIFGFIGPFGPLP